MSLDKGHINIKNQFQLFSFIALKGFHFFSFEKSTKDIGAIMVFVREDILVKLLSPETVPIKVFYVELN